MISQNVPCLLRSLDTIYRLTDEALVAETPNFFGVLTKKGGKMKTETQVQLNAMIPVEIHSRIMEISKSANFSARNIVVALLEKFIEDFDRAGGRSAVDVALVVSRKKI